MRSVRSADRRTRPQAGVLYRASPPLEAAPFLSATPSTPLWRIEVIRVDPPVASFVLIAKGGRPALHPHPRRPPARRTPRRRRGTSSPFGAATRGVSGENRALRLAAMGWRVCLAHARRMRPARNDCGGCAFNCLHPAPDARMIILYSYALSTRKLAGLMTRKLSLTESQKTAQFFGTSSRRKRRTESQKSL